ncbi:hypothetical protein DERF_005917 [Dermatophagoides farinae]|uniref:DNA-3-methyladenine glycosylase II n=1 Tax=Dermatophagoides farinae TaxID=6954 RepID=A0A922I7W4_DERFA|nr:hypothetical protein DERF_005917 [Dermatophagoides farinae]
MKRSHAKKTKSDPSNTKRLQQEFFTQYSTIELAKNLLGKLLCRQFDNGVQIKGMIVETEAYIGPEDHASYTFGGRRTVANEPMYMTARQDYGGAVLIRAVEPMVDSIDKMIELRLRHPKASSNSQQFKSKPYLLANGPSKLCIAFNIDQFMNRKNIITDHSIWLEHNDDDNDPLEIKPENIVESTRIGISSKNPWSNRLLRFYLRQNRSVSKF